MEKQIQSEVVILVAEDDLGHFLLTKRHIRHAGIDNEIVHLPDGQVAIDYLYNNCTGTDGSNCRKHLLLLDIRMPKIDGIEILEQMKAHPNLKEIPVIIVTTSDNPANVSRCKKLGCDDYIIKPLAKSFAGTLQKILGRSYILYTDHD